MSDAPRETAAQRRRRREFARILSMYGQDQALREEVLAAMARGDEDTRKAIAVWSDWLTEQGDEERAVWLLRLTGGTARKTIRVQDGVDGANRPRYAFRPDPDDHTPSIVLVHHDGKGVPALQIVATWIERDYLAFMGRRRALVHPHWRLHALNYRGLNGVRGRFLLRAPPQEDPEP